MKGSKDTAATGRGTLLTRPIVLLVFTSFAALFGFQLLLSVVPLYVDGLGGGSSGAGLVTAVFMLSTVLTQVQMPRLLRRFGHRPVLAAGLLFLGAPSFLYVFAGDVVSTLAVTLARGVGFGIVTVLFASLVVGLAPPGRRGEALGVLGVAITLPTIFCNSLGIWMAGNLGYGVVFLIGGATPLLGLAAIPGISGRTPSKQEAGESTAGFFEGLKRGPLLRVVLLFSAATMAGGVVVTFLPLAVSGDGLFSAAGALLVVGVTSTAARWWAGRFGDRRDPHLLLVPGLVASAVGVAGLASGGAVMLGSAVLFGTGFGLLQNSTLLLVMGRVPDSEQGLGSTLWNVSFDAGTGLGAVLFGVVISALGYSTAFYLCAGLVASALALAYLDRSATSGAGSVAPARVRRRP